MALQRLGGTCENRVNSRPDQPQWPLESRRSAFMRQAASIYNEHMLRIPTAWIVACLLVLTVGLASAAPSPEGLEFFENKIRPILATNCYTCHSAEAKTRMGGLSLDTRDGIREGGQRGHAVVPSDPEASLILDALRYEGGLKMPPTGKLSDEVVQDFAAWIKMGAPDPREVRGASQQSSIDLDQGRQYWAFQTPRAQALPDVRDLRWPRGAVDQYVLAALEDQGLRPVPDASKADLLRRVTYDLTGLPPSVAEMEVFMADESDRAYSAVVERLLESDRFGERWGRHWLDVVRYSDTIGRTRNLPFPMAWRYRDYVIRAFNDDKPYDRFVQEQIAGDLLPYDSPKDRQENQIATGFLALGAHDLNEPDPKQFEMDVADEMINVSTRSMLALSVGCARCHDHKFDPIPTKDYYALAGIFRSSELRNGLRRRPRFNAGYFRVERMVTLDGVPDYSTADADALRAERARLWGKLQAAEEARDRVECRKYARELSKLAVPENLAMGVIEAPQPQAMRVNIGGDPHTLGDPVDRGFVQVLYPPDANIPEIGSGESGRLQFAEWLTRPDNPLTARVMANRVWHQLTGKGIVATVDNFGSTGRQPTNQALLDHLALRFIDSGWSVKSLIREVVLSRTYRLSTQPDSDNFAKDPDNNLNWRANLRRLEAESVRDSVLYVSGVLELDATPPAPVKGFDRSQILNPGNRQLRAWEFDDPNRSVYVPVVRNLASRMFEAFDFPEPSETHGVRDVTTSPSQALLLMNGRFIRSNALIAAERLMASHSRDRDRARHAFRQVLSRDPSAAEEDRAIKRVREIARALSSDEAKAADKAAATTWLGEMLSAALDRKPDTNELSAAMRSVASAEPGTTDSVVAMKGAFFTSEGGVNGGLVHQVLEAALGREIDSKERGQLRKNMRSWQTSQTGGGGSGSFMLAASSNPAHEAWTRIYHALYNSAEFRYRN